MRAEEIRDEESLRRWLEARPAATARADAVAIAFRAAARVMPLWAGAMDEEWARRDELTSDTILRLLLTSGMAGPSDTEGKAAAASRAAVSFDISFAAAAAIGASSAAFAAAAAAAASADCRSAPSLKAAIRAAVRTAISFEGYREAGTFAASADAAALESGTDPLTLPLWPDTPPDWFTRADALAREIWAREPEVWEFWVRWWDGVLKGRPLPSDLLRDVALIPNDVWDAGPAAVAEAIRGIEAGRRDRDVHAQAEALLGGALADYSFDAIQRVMRMVPFEDDIRHLREPDRLHSFLDDAESTRDDLELFCQALAAEGAMQHAGFVRTYLNGVLEELSKARQTEHLRVGRIVEFGKILENYAADATVAAEFGPAINALRSHVEGLLALTRRHFAATLVRMAPLRDIASAPDDNPWTLLQDIQRGIKKIAREGEGRAPALDREGEAALLAISEGVERLLRQHDIVTTPDARSSIRREVDFQLALLSVSVGLYAEKAGTAIREPGKVLDSIALQLKRYQTVAALWKIVKDTLDWLARLS